MIKRPLLLILQLAIVITGLLIAGCACFYFWYRLDWVSENDMLQTTRYLRQKGIRRPLVIAHKAGGGLAPENTLTALSNLRRFNGNVWAEFDVQRSADGVLFLLHKPDLEETTSGKGPAAVMTWEQLKSLKIRDKNGFTPHIRLPRLSEALSFLRHSRIPFILDLKCPGRYPGITHEVAAALTQAPASAPFCVAAFERQSLQEIRNRTDVALVRNYRFSAPDEVAPFWQAASVYYLTALVNPAGISRYRPPGGRLYVWKANSARSQLAVVRMGVDGVITDYPDRLNALLDRLYGPETEPAAASLTAGGQL